MHKHSLHIGDPADLNGTSSRKQVTHAF